MLLLLWQPAGTQGQVRGGADSVSTPVLVHSDFVYPDLRRTREFALSGLGASFVVAGVLAQTDHEVPSNGFDPVEIAWSVDRRVVGNHSPRAGTASDWTRNAAVLFPLILALASGQPESRWSGLHRRGLVFAETFAISQGLTFFGKAAFRRPRPYAYWPTEQRPSGPGYESSAAGTFHSMPSGHSSSAWTGAAIGMTEHLLHRPDASWVERAGVGFLGGALAGATSALRVAAGQHFPSDVLAGAGVGIASGITVPLLHRGEKPVPPLSSWLQVMGGALGGVMVGILVVQAY